MKAVSVCVVSEDPSLRRDFKTAMEVEGAFKLSTRAPSDWLATGAARSHRPEVVIFDFRSSDAASEALWNDLDNTEKRARKLTGAKVTAIGIVDRGVPIDHCKAADRWLSAVGMWPSSPEALRDLLRRARLSQHSAGHESHVVSTANHQFRTYTPSLFPLFERLEMAARDDDFTILIVGETGTGKTTLASMIHELSGRSEERLLTVACGALPGNLIDSELFGHVRGAFTGADRTKSGKFEAAEGGTILLDEIDVLGLVQQAKLLRVLETGEYEPVGSNETMVARCRTIVASNISLESLIRQQRFRSDLYFRLNQVKFEIPPLRERPSDIAPMAIDFIDECIEEHQRSVSYVHPDLLEILKGYSWPGNIRQLRNEVRRAVLFAQDGVVTPRALSLNILQEVEEARTAGDPLPSTSVLAHEVAVTERESIEEMLKRHKYNRAATARALGISRVTLYNKLKKYRFGRRPEKKS
jgi:DNA-binding NtrC family response regulator